MEDGVIFQLPKNLFIWIFGTKVLAMGKYHPILSLHLARAQQE